MTKWQPFATWQPFPTEEPTDDIRPVMCQEGRCGAGKIARQALPVPSDVTLSGAFNAPCQPAELGMIALFAIIPVHNDYFAIVVTP